MARLPKKKRGALLTWQKVCGYRSGPCTYRAQSCDCLGATSPTRPNGKTSDRGLFMSTRGAKDCCLSKGRPSPRDRGEVATKHRGGGAFPYRGGSRGTRLRALRRTTTPTDSRILDKHSYEILTLGPGAISQGRGAERPKGTEQHETLQGD